jgi:hypothetical protein
MPLLLSFPCISGLLTAVVLREYRFWHVEEMVRAVKAATQRTAE